MQILYGYSNCTDKKYKEIVSENHVAVLQPDQKYHGLLIKGLSKNGAKVLCFSGLPINRAVTSKMLIYEKDEDEGNAHFHYYTTLNIPAIRQLMIFFAAFFNCLFVRKEKDTYSICDCLNIANAYGMLIACKIRRIPIFTIVTDLPDMMTNNSVFRMVNNSLFSAVDGFVFLTEKMNQRLNKKNKPYIVLEGHVDADGIDPIVVDPWASERDAMHEYGVKLTKIENVKEADCVIVAVAHKEFCIMGIEQIKKPFKDVDDAEKVLIDVKGLFKVEELKQSGLMYWRL